MSRPSQAPSKVIGLSGSAGPAPAPDIEQLIAFSEHFGVPLFPSDPKDKTPLTPHGFKDASKDPGQLRRWGRQHPGCMWGMPTGAVSGIVVLDVDNNPDQGKLGYETLRGLEDIHGKLPDTGTVLTPSGGQHLWFLAPSGIEIKSTASNIGSALDIRGDGGYAIVPPSRRLDGRTYEFEASCDPWDIGIAPMPAWLIKLTRKDAAERKLAGSTGDTIPEGQRNAMLTSLAGTMRARNFSQAAIEAALLVENAKCAPPLPESEVRAIATSVARYENPQEQSKGSRVSPAPPVSWPAPLDLAALARTEPQAPKFILPDWLPCGYATLLAGHGGVGKSGIALHLAVCIAAGVPFFGLPIERRRVRYLDCEDRKNVVHWRLARICDYTGLKLVDLAGWLDVLDLVGHQSVLWERATLTGAALTAAYGELDAGVRRQQTQVLVVDGISDTYGGNENARSEVKAFVNALLTLIPPDDGALLLIGHIAKPAASGIVTTEGYSGSTAWHNAVRARWYLYPETVQGEDGARGEHTGELLLELQKSNLGRTDQSMRFRWDDAARMFVGQSTPATTFDRKHLERTERDGILRALKACSEQNPPVIVPAAMQGPRTAYQTLVLRAEMPASLKHGKPSRLRFWRCVEALRQDGHITEREYKRVDRHRTAQLVLTDKGLRECG